MTGGAASMPLRTCKADGCGRPVRARGMCINCYERWRRANPDIRVSKLNMKAIEAVLPARTTEIRKATGLGYEPVQKLLDQLHKEGRARIGSYDPPSVTGSQYKPVWVAGPGAHAKKPSPQDRRANRRASQRHSYRRRQQQTVGWAGMLGQSK